MISITHVRLPLSADVPAFTIDCIDLAFLIELSFLYCYICMVTACIGLTFSVIHLHAYLYA